MPIYTYECLTCKYQEEITCRISEMEDMRIDKCHACHGPTQRVLLNTNKHTDNTDTRKGFHNSKDWR